MSLVRRIIPLDSRTDAPLRLMMVVVLGMDLLEEKELK